MSAGSPAGPNTQNLNADTKPGKPFSSMVGMSGSTSRRFGDPIARMRALLACTAAMLAEVSFISSCT